MSKRFMLDDAGELIDLNNHKFINYGEECCNLLNEQHETIQRLKQNIDELLSVDIEEEVLKENEQLKQRINVLDNQITAQGIVIEGYQNRNQKLFDETKQLKATNKHLIELLELTGAIVTITKGELE